ncbi:NAD-dependent epimerase/dehydratase family protein [Agreia sp. VKM Ac-1783]|uniref:NAD-dependent epimerase/dehydratase family protein n=1 Tax=Agreia sp. VKM Ac-1783 TaxID=1938889 RepID=UPI000A2AAF4C|nr:NAD-dependent epimerase/dehydratase family protein [Agreia sp. VKM Ac-1783]SMQ60558.1 UDP-glucose 4-epimerase [Agreia sp. VKM Ac-1783]
MARVVVIGANGFIGSHLVDELADRGHEVRAFDRFSSDYVAFTAPSVEKVAGDFMNQADIADAVRDQEYVFHFLSTTTPATAENDPTVDIRTNLASTVELLQQSVDAGVRKVFFASTGGAIYGHQADLDLSESLQPLPVSPYAIGKLAIEGYLRYFTTKFGIETVSFRISNPYGTRQRPNKRQGVIPIFLHRIAQGLPLTVLGDGSMTRDYVFVKDVVEMVAETVDRPTASSVYNIGSGRGATINELVEVMSRVTGRVPELEYRRSPATYLERAVLDTSLYRAEFGHDDFVSLEDGIAQTWRQISEENR